GYPWQGGSELAKSSDGGMTWKYIPTAVTPGFTGSLAIDPHNPNLLYLGSSEHFGPGIFRSEDAGETWQFLQDPALVTYAGPVVVDPIRPGVIYVGSGSDVRVTEDQGAHWRSLGPGLPSNSVDC